jgi:hypothetical protein
MPAKLCPSVAQPCDWWASLWHREDAHEVMAHAQSAQTRGRRIDGLVTPCNALQILATHGHRATQLSVRSSDARAYACHLLCAMQWLRYI